MEYSTSRIYGMSNFSNVKPFKLLKPFKPFKPFKLFKLSKLSKLLKLFKPFKPSKPFKPQTLFTDKQRSCQQCLFGYHSIDIHSGGQGTGINVQGLLFVHRTIIQGCNLCPVDME